MANLINSLQLADSDPLTPPQITAVERLAEKRIAGWWERIGEVPSIPTDDATAVRLVQAVDYDVSVEELARFVDVQAFEGVAINNGVRVWSSRDIARLALFLESRRSWLPGSELHQHKLTQVETALAEMRAGGESHEMFNDLQKFDLRALVLMLTESDNRQQRELLKVALELKLESFDIIV